MVLDAAAVDEETCRRAGKAHDGAGTHGLVVLFGVYELGVETFAHGTGDHPAVVLPHTVQQVVAHEAVQRVAAVPGVVVEEAGVGRIGLVVDALGVGLQVIDGVDAVAVVDGVGLNEGGVLEVALPHPEGAGVLGTAAGAALHRSRVDGVLAAAVGLVKIARQRVGHARQLQRLREERQRGVGLNLVGQQHTARRDGVVQHVNHAIGHRVVALYYARVLINIIYELVVVGHVAVA